MNVFIVHAHHEPASFNGALTRTAREALDGTGHQVVVGPLRDGFDPVSDRRNFATVKNPTSSATRGHMRSNSCTIHLPSDT